MKEDRNPAGAGDRYRQKNRGRMFLIVILLLLSVASFVLNVMIGSSGLTVQEILSAIFRIGEIEADTDVIVWSLRIPKAVMALFVGFALGLSGAVMQTILANPLASPYTLGVGSGASFGASLAIVGNTGILGMKYGFLVPATAFFFAMLVCMLIYLMGRYQGTTSNTMVLAGIALTFLFQALQAMVQYVASESANQQIVFWSFGSLQKSTWENVPIVAAAVIVCSPLLIQDSWKYTVMLLGDEKAESMGIRTKYQRKKAFFLISILAAAAVCFVGTIGFVGLAGPHIARRLVGEDQRFYLPVSALCGTVILSFASCVSKLVVPGTIFPIGIITSLIGVPFFFALIFQKRGR